MLAIGKFVAVTRKAFWLAALTWIVVPCAVQAGSVDLATHGGSATAGHGFRINCGKNQVLVGVAVYEDWWLDRIAGLCARMSTDGRWLGFVRETLSAGGSHGNRATALCPEDTAVTALRGRFGSYVNGLSLQCRRLDAAEVIRTVSVAGSQAGDHAWGWADCPDSKFARGFHGRAEGYVDRVGLTCHAVNTPSLQAPPVNIHVVNLVDPKTGPVSATPTPFVEVHWTDRSTDEDTFRIVVTAFTGNFSRYYIAPRAPGVDAISRHTIEDLPNGQLSVTVCAGFSTEPLCPPEESAATITIIR